MPYAEELAAEQLSLKEQIARIAGITGGFLMSGLVYMGGGPNYQTPGQEARQGIRKIESFLADEAAQPTEAS